MEIDVNQRVLLRLVKSNPTAMSLIRAAAQDMQITLRYDMSEDIDALRRRLELAEGKINHALELVHNV